MHLRDHVSIPERRGDVFGGQEPGPEKPPGEYLESFLRWPYSFCCEGPVEIGLAAGGEGG
jgi:hypothetical protein